MIQSTTTEGEMGETPEMVERVAKAIMEEIKRQVDGHPIPGPASVESWAATGGTLGLGDVARAAIEALREPTEAMLNAAGRHQEAVGVTTRVPSVLGFETWHAMIDAALGKPA